MPPTDNNNNECLDCGSWVFQYKIHTHVWLEAIPDYYAKKKDLRFVNLCFNCLEHRLGRSVSIGDFTTWPINTNIFKGWDLGVQATREALLGKMKGEVADEQARC